MVESGCVGARYHTKTQLLHLKRFPAGKKFDSEDELKESVEKWHMSQAANLYEQSVQNLVPCYYKCLNVGGSHVEK